MTTRIRLALGAAAAVLLLAGLALALTAHQPAPPPQATLKAGAYDPPRPAPDFSLAGSDGREVRLTEHRGKIVLLTFGFTYCAAVCPTTLATLAQARSALGEQGEEVQVIFVTVDPERDDPAHMRQYLEAFDRSFIGATGDPTILAEVRQDYGVTAEREGTEPNYAMIHTSSIFLIDRAGRLRAMMPFGHDAGDFVHDVRLLLRE